MNILMFAMSLTCFKTSFSSENSRFLAVFNDLLVIKGIIQIILQILSINKSVIFFNIIKYLHKKRPMLTFHRTDWFVITEFSNYSFLEMRHTCINIIGKYLWKNLHKPLTFNYILCKFKFKIAPQNWRPKKKHQIFQFC